jgi:hypothetical protein
MRRQTRETVSSKSFKTGLPVYRGWPTRGLCALALSATLIAAPPLSADQVREQLELAIELYGEGDFGGALTELEFAMDDLRKLVAGRIGEGFPDAPDGWTAAEVQSGGGAGMFGAAGTMLTRGYREQGGQRRMEATLWADSPMVQGIAMLLNNPAMISAQPNMERVRIGRESAVLKWEPNRSQAEVSLLLDGRILLQVSGSNLSEPDPVVDLLRSWDLSAVREAAQR